MDEKQQQFIADLASLALLVVQAIFHGQALFNSPAANAPAFDKTHAAVQTARDGLAQMTAGAAQ